MNEAAVDITGLVKSYPGSESPAVAGIDLRVKAGAFFGLLGPNGAGKTTLISMMCGLLRPDAGSLRMAGMDIAARPNEVKQRIGVVPQDIALYPTLTARENLAYFGGMLGLSGARLRERVNWALETARLAQYAGVRVEVLSGGLKRRLSLVIGFIHEPEILLLDEPTVGIDPHSRLFIYESLRAMNAAGMTIIYTSHYMEEVEGLCREIAIIDQGRIIARGSLDDILAGGAGTGAVEIRSGEALPDGTLERITRLPGVRDVERSGKLLRLASDSPMDALPGVLALLRRDGVKVLSLSHGAANLEEVFLTLTGRGLRE
ncbi:MAG: ABC transporter ATP-binding protein [Deltaproteobacteria bacterium]|nr:ABC transporter ATP-binding protein [Deltaproteobacteria bacterium]